MTSKQRRYTWRSPPVACRRLDRRTRRSRKPTITLDARRTPRRSGGKPDRNEAVRARERLLRGVRIQTCGLGLFLLSVGLLAQACVGIGQKEVDIDIVGLQFLRLF